MNSTVSRLLTIGFAISVVSTINSSTARSENHKSPCDMAKYYTIKLDNGVVSGSGIIFKKYKDQYFILTTAHLLIKETRKYKVYTSDRRSYSASILTSFDKALKNKGEVNDLAILKFRSKRNYTIAELSVNNIDSSNQNVFAAGFPIKNELNPQSKDLGFVCDGGKISVFLSKPMEEGYQIGYYIDIEKGMSGGPLINNEGKVIGINGKQSHPITAKSYRFYKYRDGSKVDASLDLLFDSSWAIPTQTFLVAQKSLKLITVPPSSAKNTTFPLQKSPATPSPPSSENINPIIQRIPAGSPSPSRKIVPIMQ
jgi:S1-C subfamily serine protease